jgi:hypothetical protein
MKNNPLLQDIKNPVNLNDLFGVTGEFGEKNKTNNYSQDALLIKLWLSKLHIITFNKIILSKLNSPFLELAFKYQIHVHEEQLKRIKISLIEAEFHYSFINTNRLNSLLNEELQYVNFSKQGGCDSRIIEIAIKWINFEIATYNSLSKLSYVLHFNEVFKQTKLSLREHKGLLAWLYQTKEYFH